MSSKTKDPIGGLPYRMVRRMIQVQPEEAKVLLWCWLYIFALLTSYYILRPIRDQAGVAGGVNNLKWLFTGTLITMLVLNLPFAYLVKKLPRRLFISITYQFFAFNLLLFASAYYLAGPEETIWIGRLFFSWVSVFNLFVISIFWQMMVDLFSSEQGKRLFGFIAAGATLGGILGSATTASLAQHVPLPALLLVSFGMLEVAIFCVGRLSRLSPILHHLPPSDQEERPIGGHLLAGITHLFSSSYLLNISVYLLLFSITTTFLYFEQADIVSRSFADSGAQTAFFATLDLLVNCLALGVQLFLTGRIVTRFGVGVTLALLPAMTMIGFSLLAVMPSLMTVAAFLVTRRAADYSIARPTREVLFTVIPREDRYKVKSIIDTVLYRFGDQAGAWSASLILSLGHSSTAFPAAAVPIAALWLFNALWLGRRQEAMAKTKMP